MSVNHQERLAAAERLQDQLNGLLSGAQSASEAYDRLYGPGGERFSSVRSDLNDITAEVDRLVGRLHRYVRQEVGQ